jgi:cytochrome P450
MQHLLGDTIVLMSTGEEWSKQRKAISGAFFKNKLVKMSEIIKKTVVKYVQELQALKGESSIESA